VIFLTLSCSQAKAILPAEAMHTQHANSMLKSKAFMLSDCVICSFENSFAAADEIKCVFYSQLGLPLQISFTGKGIS
jgi:hypothetical protein